jgi:hypothetical protein
VRRPGGSLRLDTWAALALVAAAGCAVDWPVASRGDQLGPEVTERGPLHRPGQPCLWCHGGPAPRAQEFLIAGTVYLREADAEGVGGATVTMTDATGATFAATTNAAGNFYVTLGGGGGRGREGLLVVATAPVFPLTVSVAAVGAQSRMRSKIERDGSCAGCHREPPGAALVGKVYVEAAP